MNYIQLYVHYKSILEIMIEFWYDKDIDVIIVNSKYDVYKNKNFIRIVIQEIV